MCLSMSPSPSAERDDAIAILAFAHCCLLCIASAWNGHRDSLLGRLEDRAGTASLIHRERRSAPTRRQPLTPVFSLAKGNWVRQNKKARPDDADGPTMGMAGVESQLWFWYKLLGNVQFFGLASVPLNCV